MLHDRNPLYVTLSDGEVRNGYNIKILNKTHEEKHFKLVLDGFDQASFEVQGAGQLDSGDLTVDADTVGHFRVFVTAPAQQQSPFPVTFSITDLDTGRTDKTGDTFISHGAH